MTPSTEKYIVCKRCGDEVKDTGKRICFQCSEEQAPSMVDEGDMTP